MGSIPFAFSVHNFIKSVGSDAGFASIIGLAILVLLYFAQARETSSLREQAYEWAQRVQQLEGRIAQLSQQQAAHARPVPAPAPAPAMSAGARPIANSVAAANAGVPSAMPAGAPAPVPAFAGAPAGVGAPALAAATKLIPTPARIAPDPAAVPERPIDATSVVAPAPATVAGGANGVAHDPVEPQPVAAVRAPVVPPPPPVQIRPAGTPAPGRRPPLPPRNQPRQPSSGARRVVVVLLIGLALAGVVVALLILTGGSSSNKVASTAGATATTRAPRQHTKQAGSVSPSSVTVAVLNGTATSGLGRRVALKLGAAGYKQGTVANAADQTRTSTVVAWLPGHRRDAQAVASALKLGSASVQPVDQPTLALACPPPATCGNTVVVTVGSDLANTQ